MSKKKVTTKAKYRLFGARQCGSMITEAFLRWAKIPYDYEELKWDERAKWPTIIGQYNSLPQVPTLILPNQEVLTETLATAVHANRKRSGLIPTVAKDADRFWRWAVFLVANIYPTFTFRDNAADYVATQPARDKMIEEVVRRRKNMWLAMEKECGDKWFLGNKFSAIDVYFSIMTMWGPGKDWFKQYCPKINAVADRTAKTEPFKKLFKDHA